MSAAEPGSARARRTGSVRPVSLTVVVVFMVVVVFSPLLGPTSSLTDLAFSVLVAGSFLAVGCTVLIRSGWHRIGWLLVGAGAAFGIGLSANPLLPPWYAAWTQSPWTFVTAFALLAYTTLVFPSGRLPSRAGPWSTVARTVAVALPVFVLPLPFVRVSWGAAESMVIPFGFLPFWVGPVGMAATVVSLLCGALSLVVRYRRSAGEERAQLGWVVSSLTLVAASVAATSAYLLVNALLGRPDTGDDPWMVALLAYLTLPFAFMVAILRYRLYDIDQLISRTVTYSVVVGVLAAVYSAIAIGLPQVLPVSLDSPLLVAGATLAAAALFNPVRHRVQIWVDRRFNRARYDAQWEVDHLTDRLRAELTLDDLTGEALHVVTKTMQPSFASVWIRRAP